MPWARSQGVYQGVYVLGNGLLGIVNDYWQIGTIALESSISSGRNGDSREHRCTGVVNR